MVRRHVCRRLIGLSVCIETIVITAMALSSGAQTASQGSNSDPSARRMASPSGLQLSSIDPSVDPCSDFYKFACGNFLRNNPIPADQPANSPAYLLYNSIAQELEDIVVKASVASSARDANEQKVGDFYASCLDTNTIENKGFGPARQLMDEIDRADKSHLGSIVGKLQRIGVNVFFNYGQMQDLKDPSKVIAVVDQGGLGLPERDYYFRDDDQDKILRDQYVVHIAKMLSLSGDDATQARVNARAVLAFETLMAKASQTVTERRTPENMYHMETVAELKKTIPELDFDAFLGAIHSPHVAELNVANPGYLLELRLAIAATALKTLHAYMRYEVLNAFALELPASIDDEDFNFNGRKMVGEQQQLPRWKRCSTAVDAALGEALNKIGYPDWWRDYSTLSVARLDAFGNQERAAAFENDRQLMEIGKPVDPAEWSMTPPTLNAYYDLRVNSINFPAGMLQPPFFSLESDPAVNYGSIGTIIGHELTHAFDDQGSQFDSKGALNDWWSPEDKKSFESRERCIVDEYAKFVVDDLHVNGKLTLGENTADNGGVLLAFMAYLYRAKKDGMDIQNKVDGYTGTQRFYIAFAQHWCQNMRPEQARNQILTDPHSPNQIRVNGVLVNQPEFATAFGCRKESPTVPSHACRVW